jgi:protein required for attachment to host cells
MAGIRVIVADSGRATFYELASRRGRLQELGSMTNPAARKHERDLGSGAPGRVMNRMGGVRHAYQAHDSIKGHAAGEFARALARRIAAAPRDRQIMIVAAPRLLSAIRQRLPKGIAARVVSELAHDLVDLPRDELQRRIRDQLSTFEAV